MHYHLEIILPPIAADLTKAIGEIMAPFNENAEEPCNAFWDWYSIGGRWAGCKLEAAFSKDRLDTFRKELSEKKVTISNLVWGKEELNPASQIPMVDALWCKHFPESPIKVCPMFQHYNPKNHGTNGWPDVMKLSDVPAALEAGRVIVAGPDYEGKSMEARYMTQRGFWNGVDHVDTKWDGKVSSALAEFREKLTRYAPDYAETCNPKDDWLCVTVDYHS